MDQEEEGTTLHSDGLLGIFSAACIGGAMHVDRYLTTIESAELHLLRTKNNPQHEFIPANAKGATGKHGA